MVKWFPHALLAFTAGAICHAQGLTHQSGANETVALKQWQELVGPANATKPLNNTEAISPWMGSGNNLFKRQREEDENGALLCRNGACPDYSCCGPNNICGYGPDFCGDGCQSNCDAVAMCGEYSQTGSLSCGLELCCSWGGWCGTSEVHCIGPNEHAPCNPKYGSCEMITPQSCGENSGTSNGRMVGYYQASNSRDRICNGITPSQIKTEGYTHLFFAFASIDPSSFVVKPWSNEDIPLMREFTKLKGQGRNLQPWIAVGGWQLNEPSEPTFTTWHDLCADKSKRTTFIASLIRFMDEYGFMGADLDWEYPGTEERGGNMDDVDNFVDLVREMREAFGTKYGISLTLAPDYWYLRYFDVGRLQQYVDHLGFMAYDLHGFWDADVDALGSIVRGQTNIEEIANNTIPLAYAKVDPSKIDLGIAWYGRGYTLSDPSCNTLGCPFSGPSKPGKCTNSAGVLSLIEIKQMIASGEATSRLLPDIGMKELVWGDQWIGYDDEETIELKRKFANDRCYGGLMAWSVDFNSGEGSGSEPPKSTDGQCGPNHGGATCPGSGFGNCCSSSGWCGSSEGHCGSACIGGDCKEGGQTTDGRCGAGFNGAFCGTWDQGTCCSSGGWCGSSDAHCGNGCQIGCDGSPSIPGVPGEGNTGNPGGGGPGDDDEEDDDDSSDDDGAKICDQNTEKWDRSAWNTLGMTEWFQDRLDWWAFQKWPDTSGTASIPNSIAKWLATGPAIESAEMYWPNSCKDINLKCGLSNDDYKDQCGPQTWQRAFVLWTLHNLSRFMQHYHEMFSVTARLATNNKLSTMSRKFMITGAEDSPLGDSAWVGLFAGLTAGLASAVPGAGAVSSGLASGILTMSQNLMNSDFMEQDPHFKNYADLEDQYSKMMTAYGDSMKSYHRHLFDTKPTTRDHRDELVNLVASGAFCKEDVGANTSDNEGIDPDDQIFAMGAALINLMWLQQKVFILELAPGKFGNLGGGTTRFQYDPCDGKATDNGLLKDMHYCADDGTSWFILGWDNIFQDFGAGQDILNDYDLTRLDIVSSSRRTQDRARGFGGLSAKTVGDTFADLAKDPSKVKNMKDMVHFSLPVCVLDSRISLDYEPDECFGPPGPTTGNRILNFRDCFSDLVMRNCAKYQHYDDSWPYA